MIFEWFASILLVAGSLLVVIFGRDGGSFLLSLGHVGGGWGVCWKNGEKVPGGSKIIFLKNVWEYVPHVGGCKLGMFSTFMDGDIAHFEFLFLSANLLFYLQGCLFICPVVVSHTGP